ncbi:MAG: helix-turn-helix domain-containing protein [Opitutaceae bacterium]|nr:helix-turn-helix domain-containing protein [Opitutaceae bacterium]
MPARRAPIRLVPSAAIQRPAPAGRIAARRVHTLRPEQIHPVVRIAHRQDGGLLIPRRIILDHELVLILQGHGTWTVDGVEHPLAPHDLLLIPPFVPHSFQVATDGPVEHIAVHFDFAPAVPPPARGLEKRRPYRVRLTHGLGFPRRQHLYAGHRLERLLQGVVAAHASGAATGPALASARLAGVLLELLDHPAGQAGAEPSARHRERVGRVTAHMQAHLGGTINHGQLERVSGLSTSRLQAVFREVTGYPPLDYLRRLRVEAARRLLADPRLAVKEIAARTGFRDTSHFSKVFRRIDGLSPAHYREALLAGGRGKQEK